MRSGIMAVGAVGAYCFGVGAYCFCVGAFVFGQKGIVVQVGKPSLVL